MTEIMQAQAIFALTIAMAEVPSGYMADLWGRKNTLILGSILLALGWIYFCFTDSFFDLLVYEVLMGLALSLFSGTDLAMLYDSQAAINSSDDTQTTINSGAKLISIKAFAEAAGALCASVLIFISINWVAPVQAFTALFPFVIALTLIEPMRETTVVNHRNNWHNIYQMMTGNRLVLWTIAAIVMFGLATIYGFWTQQKYWQHNGIAIEYYGFIWAAYCGVTSISASLASRVEQYLGISRLLLLMVVLLAGSFIGMALVGGWFGIVIGSLFQISRGLYHVVFFDALNNRVAGKYRATINSLTSLGVRVIFIVFGPALGFLIDHYGITAALWSLAGLFTPTLAVILLLLNSSIRDNNTPAKEQVVASN